MILPPSIPNGIIIVQPQHYFCCINWLHMQAVSIEERESARPLCPQSCETVGKTPTAIHQSKRMSHRGTSSFSLQSAIAPAQTIVGTNQTNPSPSGPSIVPWNGERQTWPKPSFGIWKKIRIFVLSIVLPAYGSIDWNKIVYNIN